MCACQPTACTRRERWHLAVVSPLAGWRVWPGPAEAEVPSVSAALVEKLMVAEQVTMGNEAIEREQK
jgi:hypothetical protein